MTGTAWDADHVDWTITNTGMYVGTMMIIIIAIYKVVIYKVNNISSGTIIVDKIGLLKLLHE